DLAVTAEFETRNVYLPPLPVALFVLGLGVGPLYLAPCSELYGRRKVYLASSLLFTAFIAGSALSPNMACLVILRFFCGLAGSVGLSLGAGTVRDVFAPSERGKAQAIYALGPQGGPVLGGVIGGVLLQSVPMPEKGTLADIKPVSRRSRMALAVMGHDHCIRGFHRGDGHPATRNIRTIPTRAESVEATKR
ncbi:MAG: hypothetical protein Q9207_004747, partial [Kuettlingeria erythrocarpa]